MHAGVCSGDRPMTWATATELNAACLDHMTGPLQNNPAWAYLCSALRTPSICVMQGLLSTQSKWMRTMGGPLPA